MTDALIANLFDIAPSVRYVAVRRGSEVTMHQRAGVTNASASDSDRYEELLVNPTLITLARERGQIDCGGLRFLLVGYGNFHQLVVPTNDGHVSIAFDRDSNPLLHLAAVLGITTPTP
ncbi:MAG: hypothetical protein ICV70_00775 [Jiangellaceae bacterium]|nr:hypothetical protein [Jiangellaceae bacterium]